MDGRAGLRPRRKAMLEIGRHMAGEEQPWAGPHALSVFDIGAADTRRSDALHIGHCDLLHNERSAGKIVFAAP